MLRTPEKDFRTHFLLAFTKELIRNTGTYKKTAIDMNVKKFIHEKKEIQKAQEQSIKKIEEVRKKSAQEAVKEKTGRDSQRVNQMRKMQKGFRGFNPADPFQSFFKQQVVQKRKSPSMLQIIESRLPPTVQHIKPFPMQVELNLKKVSPLVKDPLVRIIECNGAGENIHVIGTMGRKRTGIILSEEEISEIMKIFSESTKIPIEDGMNKIVFGRLILLAIVSEIVGSKFIIRKMDGLRFPSEG